MSWLCPSSPRWREVGPGALTRRPGTGCPTGGDRLALAGMNPSTCRLVEVRGDAMAPSIPGGAVVLVDLVQRGLWDGRVYLISLANEGVEVRRAHQSGKSWVFRGDHPDSKPLVYDESWTIHGRVRAVSSISCD